MLNELLFVGLTGLAFFSILAGSVYGLVRLMLCIQNLQDRRRFRKGRA